MSLTVGNDLCSKKGGNGYKHVESIQTMAEGVFANRTIA